MSPAFAPRGKYFEQFALGDEATSAGRTITEADIVAFAGLSGDHSQIHTNAEYASKFGFGQRVAHGLLALSIASGLLIQVGFIEGTILAFRELTWKFSLPIFIGDTIQATAVVCELKPVPRLGGGLVTFNVEILNQTGKIVQLGKWVALMASRPEANMGRQ
jgi:3-hydroxybutyryl-CoA dehydratase